MSYWEFEQGKVEWSDYYNEWVASGCPYPAQRSLPKEVFCYNEPDYTYATFNYENGDFGATLANNFNANCLCKELGYESSVSYTTEGRNVWSWRQYDTGCIKRHGFGGCSRLIKELVCMRPK